MELITIRINNMNKLSELKKKYRELGEEIRKLELEVTEINLVDVPKSMKIHIADRKMNWQEAMNYAASIGMRLPTKFELQAIAESTDEFNHLGWTWSSSTPSSIMTNAWYVGLIYGYPFSYGKTDSISVLCVSP